MIKSLLLILGCLASLSAAAEDIYLSQEQFLAQSFPQSEQQAPTMAMLWLDADTKAAAEQQLGFELKGLRLRYWHRGSRTAWILEEIGKDRPITFGVVVDDGKVIAAPVMVYRESRGGEVRFAAFQRQFEGAQLADDGKLDRTIDGISGATLSVNAMKKVVREALFFHNRHLLNNPNQPQ